MSGLCASQKIDFCSAPETELTAALPNSTLVNRNHSCHSPIAFFANWNQIRDTSEKMLAAFQSPEDWTYQVVPETNHALWFAGHMATADNYFISRIAPGSRQEARSNGTSCLAWARSRPTIRTIIRRLPKCWMLMRERREVLLGLASRSIGRRNGCTTRDRRIRFLARLGLDLRDGHLARDAAPGTSVPWCGGRWGIGRCSMRCRRKRARCNPARYGRAI